DGQRCQEPLFTNSCFGRPRSRNVMPKFHCTTICSTHDGLPYDCPLVTLRRTASICSGPSSWLTHWLHSTGRIKGQSLIGISRRPLPHCPALLHRQYSARSTRPHGPDSAPHTGTQSADSHWFPPETI
ncbi:MAG: hypothetical protein ACREJN_10630, partial [Nitrospiraceae bacterium]